MRVIFVLLNSLFITASVEAQPLSIRLYAPVHPAPFDFTLDQIESGLKTFKRSVEANCGFDFNYEVSYEPNLTPRPEHFSYSTVFHHQTLADGSTFPFRYFQKPLYEWIQNSHLERPKKSLGIFIFESPTGKSFAQPPAQFAELLAHPSPQVQDVLDRLIDTVLIDDIEKFDSCLPLYRNVAHELGHIFINQPLGHDHHCEIDGEWQIDCPPGNLMRVTVARSSTPRRPPYQPIGPGRRIPIADDLSSKDDCAPKGTHLTQTQCLKIHERYFEFLQ